MFITKREIEQLKSMNIRSFVYQSLSASYATISTYMLLKLLCIFLDNDRPVVCVLSGSMEPGFKRGDILLLSTRNYRCGDMLVYQVDDDSIPIIHRIIRQTHNGQMLTKGDNNKYNDISLYQRGRTYLVAQETRAGVFGYVPLFGLPTIWINTIPGLKPIIIIIVLISIFISQE